MPSWFLHDYVCGTEYGRLTKRRRWLVALDEIDKVAKRSENSSSDVSREGVQRDLLPLIEGSTVNTKLGAIKTDHILFIASGAFHLAKPSQMELLFHTMASTGGLLERSFSMSLKCS